MRTKMPRSRARATRGGAPWLATDNPVRPTSIGGKWVWTLPAALLLFLGRVAAAAVQGGTPAPDPEHLRLAAEFNAKADGVSLLVMHDGEIVFEDYPSRYHPQSGPDQAWFLASGTKSFWGPTAAAMIDDGLLSSFDERVADTIVEWQGTEKAPITLRQLLSLSSGIDPDHGGPGVPSYAVAIQSPLLDPPGTRFRYGPAPYQVFGELLRRKLLAAGIGGPKPDPVEDYLKPRILDRIGAAPDGWRYSGDDAHLPSGARFTAREWIKYGELIRLGGQWNGERIIPGSLLAECFTGSSASAQYGLTWWLDAQAPGTGGTPVVSARGAGKQHLYVSRALDLVILRQTSATGAPGLEARARQDLYDIDDLLSLILRGQIAGLDRDGDLIANARDAFPDMAADWVDADKDGLGDHFEARIIDHDPADGMQALSDVLPDADFDGDGASNLEEFLAGTDPTRAPGAEPTPDVDAPTIWLPALVNSPR